jgi:hypothetical protein
MQTEPLKVTGMSRILPTLSALKRAGLLAKARGDSR